MVLSKRLLGVANLITKGYKVADIGTDHGYIPLHVLDTAPKVIAMDVKTGPLSRARENIQQAGKEDKIELRLSNGLEKLALGEVDCVVLAGMGGELIIQILLEGKEVFESLQEVVLQPQSKLHKVRHFIQKQGWHIEAEDMVYEEGKYYPMMRIAAGGVKPYDTVELLYGPLLLQDKHAVLRQLLEKENVQCETICARLGKSERGLQRRAEIKKQMKTIQEAIERMTKDEGK